MSATAIRLIEPEDAESLLDYLVRNREFHRPFVPVPPEGYYTIAFQRQALLAGLNRRLEGMQYRFAITPTETPERIIGITAITAIEYGAFRNGRISYMMDGEWTGHGVATRSVEQLVEFAFTRLYLHRLEAHIMPRNAASRRVIEKCRFIEIGTGEKMVKINGVWEDHVIYARTADEQEGAK